VHGPVAMAGRPRWRKRATLSPAAALTP
jgi:hypothetical protein